MNQYFWISGNYLATGLQNLVMMSHVVFVDVGHGSLPCHGIGFWPQVLNFVAGPKSCEEPEFVAETSPETGGMHVGPRALGQGTLAVAVSILSVLAMKSCKAQSIIFGSKFNSEATVEPDDAVPLANAGA